MDEKFWSIKALNGNKDSPIVIKIGVGSINPIRLVVPKKDAEAISAAIDNICYMNGR